jgi:integrase
MLATGARIGEILAVRWADVALDATRPNLTINGTIKTEPGKGTYRKPSPKSDASVRTVVLPDFAIAVLKRRQAAARENSNGAVFQTRNGTWQQVNNVERRWRQIRKDTGLDWVTPTRSARRWRRSSRSESTPRPPPSSSATPPPPSPASSTSPSRRSPLTSRTSWTSWPRQIRREARILRE